ncbi:MAG: hypothetical protein AUG51_04720 [Acidobacteria bacterium 13_1_20CM_3_53_8]|nr:MAG: hypothetical protein AUG51_04720 [Acidobacteria bacterium 13_1_20CM_3_53_8]
MSFLDRFRRPKEDPEVARRNRLLREGRITEGCVMEVTQDNQGNVTQILYSYEINSVEYESVEILNNDQRSRTSAYVPGATILIRYDPRQPGNSIVVKAVTGDR